MTISLIQAKRLYELGVETPARLLHRVDSHGCTLINGFTSGGSVNKTVRYPEMGVAKLEAYNAEELISILIPIYNSDWYDVVTRLADSNYASLTECLCEELIHILEGTV